MVPASLRLTPFMQVRGVEIAHSLETRPIDNGHRAAEQSDRPVASQPLDRAVYMYGGERGRISDLLLRQRDKWETCCDGVIAPPQSDTGPLALAL